MGVPGSQLPSKQLSPVVQALPDTHEVPSGAAGLEHVPLDGLHVPATWHGSLAVHVTGLDPVHAPDWQASAWVHAFPSLHGVPSGMVGLEHEPDVESHAPAVWHWSRAVHTTGFEPVQEPPSQAYAWLHGLVPVHTVPSATGALEQVPLLGSHVPAVWQSSVATHVTGFDPVQVPVWHVSVCVHAFPSVHDVPSDAGGFEQAPVLGVHVPATWHWSLAVQVTGLPPVQAPLWQVSVCVHALPSLQVVPFAATGFEQTPVVVLHVPTAWHWSLAVHVTGFAPTQVPA
jgi:hypothetical protein